MNVATRNLSSVLAGLAATLLASAGLAATADYPKLTAIPPAPLDLRSQAEWADAVADLTAKGEAIRAEAARPSGEPDTAAFVTGARSGIDPMAGAAPTAEDQAASLAFAKAIRARASAPPRRR